MTHVFISYSHKDSDYAHRLATELERRGLVAWIDDRIDYGTAWPDVMEQHIDTCAAFIVVLTSRSKDSIWVKNELAYAMGLGKPIFPLLLEGNYWLSVAAIQCVDVRNGRLPTQRFYNQLVQVMPPNTATLETPAAPRPGAAEKTRILASSQLFEPEMILIPAGEFLMGSDPRKDRDAREDEQPQHRLHLPDYYIARTPVTKAQYLAFVQATGHRQPRHQAEGNPPPGKEDHPVVNVTWHDAMAYCRWLAQATGQPYNLPSEAEWEKGARGTDGRIYPWDDEWDATRCNTREGGKGDTTPVGAYSPGASPYGLLDMAGNVWEWTRSLWGRVTDKADFGYPYDPEDGREDLGAGDDVHRVVRGGSFYFPWNVARCAFRRGLLPVEGWNYFGFRVCVVAR